MRKNITLKQILETEPFTFTLAEIEQIIDEELSSPIDTMDTELIDLCANILAREIFLKCDRFFSGFNRKTLEDVNN